VWYASYQLPGSDRRVFFEATGNQLNAIFGDGQRPIAYTEATFTDLSAEQTFAGDIIEVQGRGTFEATVQRTIDLALDEGRLPDWAQGDAAILDLIYIAHTEGKTQEWLIEQIAKLPSFQTRFPNISALEALGLDTTEAVGAFLEFEMGVRQQVARYGGDVASVTPSLVGDLIAQGQSLEDVQFVFDTFQKHSENAASLDAFNEVLAARGLQPLTFDDQLAFLEGKAAPELYQIWEEAAFNIAEDIVGLNLGVSEVQSLARRTAGFTSFDAALEGLSRAASDLLRFRSDIAFDRFDLDQEDLIDLSLGLAPRSGRGAADLARAMDRAALSARAARERQTVGPFRGFTPEGVPQAVSQTRSRTRGA
jgi:hypothetical protein